MCMFDQSEPLWVKDRKRLIAYKVLFPRGKYGNTHPQAPWRYVYYPLGEVVSMAPEKNMELLRNRYHADRGIFAFAELKDARRYRNTMAGCRVFKVNLSGRVIAYAEKKTGNFKHPAGYRAEQCKVIEEVKES